MIGQATPLSFGTTFGYMAPSSRRRRREGCAVRACHGYKTADNLRHLRQPDGTKAPLAGRGGRRNDEDQRAGRRGLDPDSEVIRNINSFTLECAIVQPEGEDQGRVGHECSIAQGDEAAQSMINGGPTCSCRTPIERRLQTGREGRQVAFGWDSDMKAYGPEAHLASAVIDWGPSYVKAPPHARRARGTCRRARTWWGVKEGAMTSCPSPTWCRRIESQGWTPPILLKMAALVIWKGPHRRLRRQEVLAKDVVADDKFLGNIKFYVAGWDGQGAGPDK